MASNHREDASKVGAWRVAEIREGLIIHQCNDFRAAMRQQKGENIRLSNTNAPTNHTKTQRVGIHQSLMNVFGCWLVFMGNMPCAK
jgi:hypothetical protein